MNRTGNRLKDLTGKRFGKLTVICRDFDAEKRLVEGGKESCVIWRCVCDCGNYTTLRSDSIRKTSDKSSCGCARYKDVTGEKFGKLLVIERVESKLTNRGKYIGVFKCKCECGNYVNVAIDDLQGGKRSSCGCNKVKHGLHVGDKPYVREMCNRLYKMKQRCYNESDEAFNHYGGRGIKICDEWMDVENGVLNFYNWAMSSGYEEGLSIDRIDVNGNYEPKNCRWATMKEQGNNRRSNVIVCLDGENMTLKQASEKYNVNYSTLMYRLNYMNLNIEEALTIS